MINLKKEKVILVIHDCSFSGAPLLGLNIMRELKKKGCSVFVICLAKGILFKEYRKNSFIINPKSLNQAEIIIKILKKFGYNKVICNSVMTGEITKIADKNDMNVITLIHELPKFISILHANDKAKHIIKHSNKIVFPNNFVKDKVLEKFSINQQKIIIKPQGLYINIMKYYDEKTKIKKKQELGFLANEKIVLGIGPGNEIKGVDLFFKTAELVHSHDKNVKFIWVGIIDKKFNWVIRKAKKSGVIILPPTNHIENYYRISDLYLMSSRLDSFPSVVLEALAYGIPVLGFEEGGGFTEINKNYMNLVKYLDYEAMADKVEDILANNDYLSYIKKNGIKYIKSNFNFSKYVEDIISLF